MKKLFLLFTVMLATSMGLLAQGTSWQTATLIGNGSTLTGTLDASTTEAWYKIIVTQDGVVNLTANSTETLTLSTYGSEVYGMTSDNTTYSRGRITGSGYSNVTITYQGTDMGKGTYYIRIVRYGGAGTFSLKYTFTRNPLSNDPEPNNDYQSASLLQSNTSVTGHMGFRTSDNVTDTQDWYKIVVPEEGTVEFLVIATQTQTQNLTLSTYSSVYGFKNDATYSRGRFSANGSYSDDTITYKATDVGAGTYYINLGRYAGCGGYTIGYRFTPCSLANDPEPNDDYQHSGLLESGTTVQGRLGYRTSDDITDIRDWYKIVVPEEGQIEIKAIAIQNQDQNMTFSTYSTVYGFKNDATYSRGRFSANGSYSDDTITYKATDVGAGTYYIELGRYGGCGGYTLYYKFTPCPMENDFEPDDDYQHYNRLINGKTSEGRLGYRTSDDVTDTQDWYRIIVPKDGPVEITATASESLVFSTRSPVQLMREDGSLSTVGYLSGSGSGYYDANVTFQKDNLAAGTYYINLVRYGGCGGYTIRYNGPASDIPGDVDGDGVASISDISELIDYLLNGDSSSSLANGDVDGDGRITIADVSELTDIMLGNY